MKKDLAQIIRDNPGCVAIVDNDCWWLYKSHPNNAPDDCPDEWLAKNELANSGNVKRVGDGYGSGNRYGGDILQALAQIVGIAVDSV